MNWLSTWLFHPALALGVAAVASPILIHILSRRRFKLVRWPAMEFLLAAHKRNRRRVQIEQLILLALRCLIVALLAMLVARPFLRPSAAAAILGSAPRTERIILLDDSFSMGYRLAAGQTVFARAAQSVDQLARWIAGESPDDSLTLLRTSQTKQPLVALPGLGEENLARLHDALSQSAATDLAAGPADALPAIADLIRSAPVHANTAVWIITDLQRKDWLPENLVAAGQSSSSRPPSVIAPLAALAAAGRSIRLTLVDVGAEHPDNLALTAIDATAPRAIARVPGRYLVSVTNFSDAAVNDAELRVAIAEQALPPVALKRIEPHQTLRESVEANFPNEGSNRIVADVAASSAPDRLPLDNRRGFGADVAAAISLLIVDGEPSNDDFRDEVHLLKTALSPAGRVSSGNDIRVITDEQLATIDFRSFDAVFLANVYRVDENAQHKLEQYVRDGGGLVIFTGDQIDTALYNDRLFAAGRGLLPAELGETISVIGDGQGVTIDSWDAAHPIFRPFAGEAAQLLRGARFYAFTAARPAGETAATSAPASQTTTTRPAARALATLTDAERSPLMIERSYGDGRVLLVTTSADMEWNAWGRDPSYLPVMLQIAQYVVRPSEFTGQVIAGNPIRLSIDPNQFALTAKLRLPSYPADPPYPIEAKPSDTGFHLLWDRTDHVGLYSLELKRPSGDSLLRYIYVNPDPRESDLRRATPDELRAALHEMKFEYVRNIESAADQSASARRELWWPIVLVVVGLLMVEQTLARWFGARG